MSEELKPCPFCGGVADVEEVELVWGVGYYVACRQCDAQMADSQDSYRDASYAIAAWNRRTPTSAPAQPLDMPDWSQAPEWAQWWAVDANGAGWWYEYKPGESKDDWFSGRNRMRSATPFVDWRATLRQRPDAGSAPEA